MYGQRIKRLRLSRGLTQEELCSKICARGVSMQRSTLACYEKEKREPDINIVIALAQFFGVTSDYILGLSEYETQEREGLAQSVPLSNEALEFFSGKIKGARVMRTLDVMLQTDPAGVFLCCLYDYATTGYIDRETELPKKLEEYLRAVGMCGSVPEMSESERKDAKRKYKGHYTPKKAPAMFWEGLHEMFKKNMLDSLEKIASELRKRNIEEDKLNDKTASSLGQQ